MVYPRTNKENASSVLGFPLSDVSEKYELLDIIGQGTFGVVRKCRSRSTGEICAVKTILKSKVPNLELLKKEVDLLSQVNHPHIIKLYEAFEEDNKLHLVTELCTGGELYDRVVEKSLSPEQHFSEYDAARILRNILEAISYCHDEKNICHRDLKVENFLLLNKSDDAPVKIIDFGLSRFNPDNVMSSRVGTVYYVAPEVVVSNDYSNKCDIWSIGVIAYVLLCGFPPFYAENESKTLQLVMEAPVEFPSPIWDDVSTEAKAFILRLLNRDPVDRPAAKDALNDPWLNHQHVQPQGLARPASFANLCLLNSAPPTNVEHTSNNIHLHDLAASMPVGRQHGNSIQMKSGKRERFHRFLRMIRLKKEAVTDD